MDMELIYGTTFAAGIDGLVRRETEALARADEAERALEEAEHALELARVKSEQRVKALQEQLKRRSEEFGGELEVIAHRSPRHVPRWRHFAKSSPRPTGRRRN